MDTLSFPQLLFFGLVIVFSYSIRGGAGFGGATVPLLALIMSVKTVAPMVTFLGLISSFAIVRRDRKYIVWSDLWRVMPWCGLGVVAGLYLFATVDARNLARALGAFVLAYGVYSFWTASRPGRELRLPLAVVTSFAGSIAGFVGTLFGANAGTFLAIYLDLMKHAKHQFRATIAATLLALGILRGLGYLAVGAFDREALTACAAALPLMAVGVFLGNRIHAGLNQLMFQRLIAVVLIVSGALLLLR